jgi:hypothetical protein
MDSRARVALRGEEGDAKALGQEDVTNLHENILWLEERPGRDRL